MAIRKPPVARPRAIARSAGTERRTQMGYAPNGAIRASPNTAQFQTRSATAPAGSAVQKHAHAPAFSSRRHCRGQPETGRRGHGTQMPIPDTKIFQVPTCQCQAEYGTSHWLASSGTAGTCTSAAISGGSHGLVVLKFEYQGINGFPPVSAKNSVIGHDARP